MFRFSPALVHRRSKQSSNETSNESNLIIIQNGANGRKRKCAGDGEVPVSAEESWVPSFEEQISLVTSRA